MRSLKLLIVAVALGLVVGGCKKEKSETKTAEIIRQAQTIRESAVGTTIQWLGHASFRISHDDKVIYIDPWKLKHSPSDATHVLVSHSHHDHYSKEDIAKVSGPDTKLVASADVVVKESAGEPIMPGLTVELGGVCIIAMPAYNPKKEFHPKANNWVGFVIELGSKRIYYAGDTDLTEEIKSLKNIDAALLPVGGKYTMDAADAADAANHIKPKVAIPYHWGDIVGSKSDAERFAAASECSTKVLMPGESIDIE
jgi:L-ascorbate metabolism protein UlaG (beta-lactamase superfamily)